MHANGALEVEHILELANFAEPILAEAIDQLATELEWSRDVGSSQAPFGVWATVVSEYCRSGCDGLRALSHDPAMLRFVLGLLEELDPHSSLPCLQHILSEQGHRLAEDTDLSLRLAAAINLCALKLNSRSMPECIDQCLIREFLHGQFELRQHEVGRGTIFCALRFFGDASSLALIKASPKMSPHWEPARTGAIRSISKRLKAGK